MLTTQPHELFFETKYISSTKSILSNETNDYDKSSKEFVIPMSEGKGIEEDQSKKEKQLKMAMLRSTVADLEQKILLQREFLNIKTKYQNLMPSESELMLERMSSNLENLKNMYLKYCYFNGFLREKQIDVNEELEIKYTSYKALDEELILKSIDFSKNKKKIKDKSGLLGTLKKWMSK